MLKKIILAAATFAVISLCYVIYQWQDDTVAVTRRGGPADPSLRATSSHPRPAVLKGSAGPQEQALTIGMAKIAPGEAQRIRVYDRHGNEKLSFQAKEWWPANNNEVHMIEPTARLLLPGGQVAEVRADEGEVVVQRTDNDTLDPKRGSFRGHVRVFIDLSKPQWREANPKLAEPQDHPEAVVKIWLDQVRFDLDLNLLDSEGPITLQSTRGTIEGRGLRLLWDEVRRLPRELRIEEGKRATLRNVKLAESAEPAKGEGEQPKATGEAAPPNEPTTPSAVAVAPAQPDHAGGREAEPSGEPLTFLDLQEEPAKPKEDRVDSYRVVFHKDVVAEQCRGMTVVGGLKANLLEVLCDVGPAERSTLEQVPGSQPAAAGDKTGERPAAVLAGGSTGSTVELRWTGPMEIKPVDDRDAGQPAAKRLHVLATGSPVEIYDPQAGRATCRELQYRDEAKEVRLLGAEGALVTLQSGEHDCLTGQTIIVDQKAGKARVEGAGKLVRKSGGEGQPGAGTGLGAAGLRDEFEITWNRAVDIEFGQSGVESPVPEGVSFIPKGTYLKHAVFDCAAFAGEVCAQFDGQVAFTEADRSIAARGIEIWFAEPASGGPPSGAGETQAVVDRIVAVGDVRMTQETKDAEEQVSCGRLEVVMTLDDTGKNVPKIARAFDKVVALQIPRKGLGRIGAGSDQVRRISAEDRLEILLASVPKQITEADRARLEAAARGKGIEPGSAEWQEHEQELRNRREIAITSLLGKGKVTVRDPQEQLDLAADSLECKFDQDSDIRWALVAGQEGQAARVGMEDFQVEGRQISVDVPAQSAEVPGAGSLWFLSKQDLDGRPVDDPIRIKVTWQERMSLRGRENDGTFLGAPRVASETTTLTCRRELRLRFEDLPKPAGPSEVFVVNRAATSPAGALAACLPVLVSLPGVELLPALAALPKVAPRVFNPSRRADEDRAAASTMSKQIRKRLAHLRAVDDAVIKSQAYERRGHGGLLAQWWADTIPKALQARAGETAESKPRMVSRVTVAGPEIAINLEPLNEYLWVEGAGKLFVEDYRLPEADRAAGRRGSGLVDRAAVASLDSLTPSQTLFQWDNSMSFLNSRNVAVFPGGVNMKHLAGSKITWLDEMAAVMGIAPDELRKMKGREATLNCDNLLVGFERDAGRGASGPAPLSRAVRLEHFRAAGGVLLRENVRSVSGALVTYDNSTGIGRVFGEPQQPALFVVEDERAGRSIVSSVKAFTWDQKTGVLEAKDTSVVAAGR